MKAYIFPGQGAQYIGMGKELYDTDPSAKEKFEIANDILEFRITDIMFEGSEDDLKQTKVTQPAIFLHSVILADTLKRSFMPDMVAGHSLGEFSSLVASKALTFEDGLKLVIQRATAMQKACEAAPSTMAAIIGLGDNIVEDICNSIDEIVVPANYNCPGQLVISGSIEGVNLACKKLTEAGARRALVLNVGGAFHSPLMQPAQQQLETAINNTHFDEPVCPVYQNVTAVGTKNPDEIREHLVAQLTAPVRWSMSVQNMMKDGADSFTEVGPGKALQGMVKKINREMETMSL